ncbi:MAG TPA: class I SAM-dependent methyltransferase [Vicinamibacteria bacterium]|nr:class I SAM-dependent methyltransferase [Vicinamibacteria bacterium]
MSETRPDLQVGDWVGWCCSYCAAPLRPLAAGLLCVEEQRWFATQDGVHRLLPEERRREIRPFLELYQRVRRDDGWRAEVCAARGTPLDAALALAEPHLGPGPWKVLEAGGGCCWASVRLLARGHQVAAVDVNLDPDDGLLAANRSLPMPEALPRAEAEMDALPLEAGAFDLVMAVGSLHGVPRLLRTLVELRRVTRRGGALLVFDSPVFRRRPDGEAMVAERMRRHARRYPPGLPRESEPSYLVLGELRELFAGSGWRLDVHGWPVWWRERLGDAAERGRGRPRPARLPILFALRDG